MATHADAVKRRVEAAALPNDANATCKSKRAMCREPEKQAKKSRQLLPLNHPPDTAGKAIEDRGKKLMTSIQSLCPELLAMIFRQLSVQDKANAACVCSLWHDVIDIPSVWENVFPSINVDKLTLQHIERIQIRKINKINVITCSNMNNLKEILQALPNLNILFLSIPLSSQSTYPESGEDKLPRLFIVDISSSSLNAHFLQSFLQPMVNLHELIIKCNPFQNIFGALKYLKHLVSLEIQFSWNESMIAIASMGDLEIMPSLEDLIFEGATFGDSGLAFISRTFPKLDVLELMLSTNVTSDGFKHLAKLKELRFLKITSEHFEDDWMEYIQTELSDLIMLTLDGCVGVSNQCLLSISKMPALLFLYIPIQGDSVNEIQILRQGCPCLRGLYLVNKKLLMIQSLPIVQLMPNLQQLLLYYFAISCDFFQVNSFCKLKDLFFLNCQLQLEHCWLYLLQMANLEELSFIGCELAGFERIGLLEDKEGFKALTSLALKNLAIEDENLVFFSRKTPFLTKLEIASCERLTMNGLAAAVSNLPHLTALHANISAETKHRLESIRPQLQFYNVKICSREEAYLPH